MPAHAKKKLPISPVAVLWLTVVWVLLWGTLDAMTVLGGVLVALLVLLVFPLPRLEMKQRIHPWPMVVLIVRFLSDVVVASLHVAWLAFRPGPTPRGLVMDLQLNGDDELQQTITAEMVALVPGSVVIELDSPERILTLHYIGITTRVEAEQVRRKVLAQEARVIRAFHPDPDSLLDPRRRREAAARDMVPRMPEGSTGSGDGRPEGKLGSENEEEQR